MVDTHVSIAIILSLFFMDYTIKESYKKENDYYNNNKKINL